MFALPSFLGVLARSGGLQHAAPASVCCRLSCSFFLSPKCYGGLGIGVPFAYYPVRRMTGWYRLGARKKLRAAREGEHRACFWRIFFFLIPMCRSLSFCRCAPRAAEFYPSPEWSAFRDGTVYGSGRLSIRGSSLALWEWTVRRCLSVCEMYSCLAYAVLSVCCMCCVSCYRILRRGTRMRRCVVQTKRRPCTPTFLRFTPSLAPVSLRFDLEHLRVPVVAVVPLLLADTVQ